ncbi:MAG: hypothetical protein AAFN08_01380 [Cyanobacteria bacterium J06559_3]
MTSINRNPPPTLPPGSLLGIGIAIVAIGTFSLGQHRLDRRRYNRAIEAQRSADCQTAIAEFDAIINQFRLFEISDYVLRAQELKAECDRFQEIIAKQQAGEAEAALLDYMAFVNVYEDSTLLNPVQQQIAELFRTAPTDALATQEICRRIEGLMTQNLIPETGKEVGNFYLACGDTLASLEEYPTAIYLYEQVADKPNLLDEAQMQTLEQALARVTVADTRQGSRAIGPPTFFGYTADGTTVIEIQNDAPREMAMTFSGLSPKFETVERCRNCQIYREEDEPEICPEKGPIEEYKLLPGQYEIAADFIEEGSERITSWTGDWTLDEGARYRICFVVVHGLEELEEDFDDSEPQENPRYQLN